MRLGMLVPRLIEVGKLILNVRGTISRGPRLYKKGEVSGCGGTVL